jgi:hypothetical protein
VEKNFLFIPFKVAMEMEKVMEILILMRRFIAKYELQLIL